MTRTATLEAPASDRVVTAGDNGGPVEAAPDPFDAHKVHMTDLLVETSNWADGVEIENDAQLAVVEQLISDWKDAIAAADSSRDATTKPLQAQVTAIQQRYWELTGDTTKVKGIAIRAKTVLLQVKTTYGNKKEAERQAEAERLRKEAAEQARAASGAAREAHGNLEATELAEDLIKGAQATLRAATQAEKPPVKGMRDNWIVKGFLDSTDDESKPVSGRGLAIRHYLRTRPNDLADMCLELARHEVKFEAKRSIPGLEIVNDRKVV